MSGHTRQASSSTLPKPKRADSKASLKQIQKVNTSSFGGTGRVGNLTPQQASTLAQFRREIDAQQLLAKDDSLGTDDATLLRFLRARDFNVPKAMIMIKNCLGWRSSVCDVGMDKLYEEVVDVFDYPDREAVFEHWPLYFHGVSKQGLPINIQNFGKIDLRKLYNAVDQTKHWQAVVANCEALPRECMPACSEASGRHIEGAFCIVDLKGFSVSQFWGFRAMSQRLFQISQDYYPETMGKVEIINAPGAFSMIWRVIKPWLAPVTIAKINIVGANYREELLAHIDADQLPSTLGGTCQCPGKGCMLTSPGPWQDARKRYGVEAIRKGRARAGKPNPAAANDPAATEAAEKMEANGHDDAEGAEVLQSVQHTTANGSTDPATAQPPQSMPTQPPGDPKTALAPGQGHAVKRQTSHGVERVLERPTV